MRPICILLFLFVIDSSIAQSNYQRSFGGLGKDCADAIITTSDGGYAIVGQTHSFGAGGNDIVVAKFEADGSVQWQKTFGGPDEELGNSLSIMESPDGGFVVTGTSASFPGVAYTFMSLRQMRMAICCGTINMIPDQGVLQRTLGLA